MVRIETREYSQHEWHDIISGLHGENFLQLWEYGEVRRLDGWRAVRHTFWIGSDLVGAAQGIMKVVPFCRRGVVWFNQGPLWKQFVAEEHECVHMLVRALREYWVDARRMYLRIAPPVRSEMMGSQRGFMGERCSLRLLQGEQWVSARVDLTRPIEDIRGALGQGWRRGLRAGEVESWTFSMGHDVSAFDQFLADYQQLLEQKQFATVFSPRFLRMLQHTLPEERKMHIAIIRSGWERLGSICVIPYGGGAEFLAGGVTQAGRKTHAGKVLFWKTMLALRESEFAFFDLGGMHPTRTESGILQFKRGIGGEPYEFIGKYDAARGIVAHIVRAAACRRL